MPKSAAAKAHAPTLAALRPAAAFQDLILTLQQFWGSQGWRDPAALRHGGRRRHVSSRDYAARTRAETLERGLRAAIAPTEGRPLRREPEPAAALLPVPGDPEALARPTCRRSTSKASLEAIGIDLALKHDVRFVEDDWGEPDARRLGARLGGAGATGWRCRSSPTSSRSAGVECNAGLGRTDLWAGAAGDVRAGGRERVYDLSTSTGSEGARRRSPTATCSCRPSRSSRATTSSTRTPRSWCSHFKDAEAECNVAPCSKPAA